MAGTRVTCGGRQRPRRDRGRARRRRAQETTRPSLILVRTHLGYGSPEQDSFKAHGSPLGVEDVRKTKQKLGWPTEPDFLIPDEALAHFREAVHARRERRSRMERAHGRLRQGLPATAPQELQAPPARRAAARLGRGHSGISRRRQGPGHARRLRQGDERHRAAAAGADRRLGRPRSLDAKRH